MNNGWNPADSLNWIRIIICHVSVRIINFNVMILSLFIPRTNRIRSWLMYVRTFPIFSRNPSCYQKVFSLHIESLVLSLVFPNILCFLHNNGNKCHTHITHLIFSYVQHTAFTQTQPYTNLNQAFSNQTQSFKRQIKPFMNQIQS